jgi:NIPSNAP
MNKKYERDNMQSPLNDRALSACLLKPSYLLAVLCGAALMLAIVRLPASSPQPPHHVYELRLYHVKEGKIDTLKARFADHTDAIFKRHNMKSIGYWSPEDAPDSQNLFVYILEHPSRQEAEKNWAAFQADPEWQKVKKESEANGPLVDHIDHYFMDPTSFSALK